VTDGLPGLALSSEKAEKDSMSRPPRHPKESIFAQGLGMHVMWVGLLMGAVTLGTQAWAIHENNAHWQTMAFNVLCLSQMGHVMAIRSESQSSFLQPVFRTEALSLGELAIVLAVSSIVFIAVEIEKAFTRRRKQKNLQTV
jgi:Ca2+-transporting ATPase